MAASSVPERAEPRGDAAQSVVRACAILRAFHSCDEVLALGEVVARTGLHKTTAFRLLQSLVQGGLVQRSGKGAYRCLASLDTSRSFRIGFAGQTDSEFSREVAGGLQRVAAMNRQIHLISVNNRYSEREALRNADLLVRERVDLVFEFQTYQRVAPLVAARFLEANIPVIAIEVPHPGATFYGANNYQAGQIAGRALGRWVREAWPAGPEQILLLELPIAGPLPALRITGALDGARLELPGITGLPVARLDGRGGPEQVFGVVRRYLRRAPPRRTLTIVMNDVGALAALRAFEEADRGHLCAVVGQNGTREAREELRRPHSRLIGSVAYFPERYGEDLIPLALALLRRQPTPPAVFVRHRLLTPANVDLIYPLDAAAGASAAGARRPR